jgi:hypothetical protein
MSKYHEQFESQVAHHREMGRLLLVNNIHHRALPAEFEEACRSRLSRPETATFFWREPEADKPWLRNRGWVFVGFDFRKNFRLAQDELEGWVFRDRPIGLKRASRVAVGNLASCACYSTANADHSSPLPPCRRLRS